MLDATLSESLGSASGFAGHRFQSQTKGVLVGAHWLLVDGGALRLERLEALVKILLALLLSSERLQALGSRNLETSRVKPCLFLLQGLCLWLDRA